MVPADQLIAKAKELAKSMPQPRALWDRHGASFDAAPYDFKSQTIIATIAQDVGVSDYQLKHYPAYTAIINCVVGGWNMALTQACDREMDIFVELMRDPVAGNMVRTLFLNRQKASKLGLLAPDSVLTRGEHALLPALKAANEQAKASGVDEATKLALATVAALRCARAGGIDQPELADVAAVIGGLFPSYAGGPFTYARQIGPSALAKLAGDDAAIAAFFAEPAAAAA